VERRIVTAQHLAARLLSGPLPDDRGARVLLLAIRRMGAYGLKDAVMAQHFLTLFGTRFRRPLMLTRIMLSELAQAASTPIQIAPCCCPRMTSAERAVVDAASRILDNPLAARLLIADLLDTAHPNGVVASVAAMAEAYRDTGVPIGGWG
jgi:hypothetical protein